MATPDQKVVSRPQRPARGPKGNGACLGALDSLECMETQEMVLAEVTMLKKAQEFFQTCDAEGKGFIARRDMQVRGARLSTWKTKWPGSPCLSLQLGPSEATSYTEKRPSLCPGRKHQPKLLVPLFSGFAVTLEDYFPSLTQ